MSVFGRSGFATTRDGRRLHHVTRGNGRPAVVFESGLGTSRTVWGLVQYEVGEACRAVAYDRAGLGNSDIDPAPRTVQRMADDLIDLLTALECGPAVLVGHSLGGAIVRAAAYQRPELVAGLVLVDQTAEDCSTYYKRWYATLGRVQFQALSVLARTGVLDAVMRRTLSRYFPTAMVEEMRAVDFSEPTVRAGAAELAALPAGLRELLETGNRQSLPPVPVTVITARQRPRILGKAMADLTASHQRLAAALPRGRHVWAEQSGHLIPWTEPELIAAEIRTLLTLTTV